VSRKNTTTAHKMTIIDEIEKKAETALRALSDTDVELNEIIVMCKKVRKERGDKVHVPKN